MGKRSNMKRIEKDFYRTIDQRAVAPLLPLLERDNIKTYAEPCCGFGDLVGHIGDNAKCVWRSDVQPVEGCVQMDGRELVASWIEYADAIITNPPWSVPLLHELIEHFKELKPTYLLFYADWAHTKQSSILMDYCSDIVTVGRVRWIPDTKMSGKDNCAWYRFQSTPCETVFHGWQSAA